MWCSDLVCLLMVYLGDQKASTKLDRLSDSRWMASTWICATSLLPSLSWRHRPIEAGACWAVRSLPEPSKDACYVRARGCDRSSGTVEDGRKRVQERGRRCPGPGQRIRWFLRKVMKTEKPLCREPRGGGSKIHPAEARWPDNDLQFGGRGQRVRL